MCRAVCVCVCLCVSDEGYTMSQWSANLIPGIDCPYDATYINFASWM